jgi:hypothetical protein
LQLNNEKRIVQTKITKVEKPPAIQAKPQNNKLQVRDRISVLYDDIWYDGTIQSINRGILTTNFDNGDVDRIKLAPKMENINWKRI